MTITTFLVSCENLERYNLISDFEDLEEYRVWIIEKSIDENDSVYYERKTFKAFDSNDRMINKGNFKFYFYDGETDQIKKTTTVLMRGINVRTYSQQYDYDQKGLLQSILRVGESIDTIQLFKYDENGNLVESTTGYKTIVQEFEGELLKKRILIEGDTKPRISEFKYDSLKRPIIENWVFSGNHRMKTQFEYYSDGNLFQKTDSSYAHHESPNSVIESREQYKYDEQDSISEIIYFRRIQSESTFKIDGRKIFERILERNK